MLRFGQIYCDECDRLLRGKNGTISVNGNFFTLQGRLRWHYVDEIAEHYLDTDVVPNVGTVGKEQYAENIINLPHRNFCDLNCIAKFFVTRLAQKVKYHSTYELAPIDAVSVATGKKSRKDTSTKYEELASEIENGKSRPLGEILRPELYRNSELVETRTGRIDWVAIAQKLKNSNEILN